MTSCMAQLSLGWRSSFSKKLTNAAGRNWQAVGFTGPENLGKALEGADLVVIPAGVPRKPGAPTHTSQLAFLARYQLYAS